MEGRELTPHTRRMPHRTHRQASAARLCDRACDDTCAAPPCAQKVLEYLDGLVEVQLDVQPGAGTDEPYAKRLRTQGMQLKGSSSSALLRCAVVLSPDFDAHVPPSAQPSAPCVCVACCAASPARCRPHSIQTSCGDVHLIWVTPLCDSCFRRARAQLQRPPDAPLNSRQTGTTDKPVLRA